MGGDVAVGIMPRLADIDADAGQIGRIDFDPADFFPAQVLAYGNRHECAAPAGFPQDSPTVVFAYIDDCVETFQRLLHVECLFRDHDDAVVLNIDGQRSTVPVHDVAARRRQKTQIDPILVGQHLVAFGFEDLKIIEPSAQTAEQGDFGAGEHSCPAAKCLYPQLFRLHGGLFLAGERAVNLDKQPA